MADTTWFYYQSQFHGGFAPVMGTDDPDTLPANKTKRIVGKRKLTDKDHGLSLNELAMKYPRSPDPAPEEPDTGV